MSQSVRTLGAGALGALIVAVAALTVHAGPSSAAAPASPADPATHTITVAGSGKVTVVPDVARVSLGVTITTPTVKAARAAAASAMTNIIAAVKAQGVADADIQTVGLNLYPQYVNGSSTRIAGYTLSEQIQITIRDLDKTGDIVDVATTKGATNLNGISFELADPAKAMNDARAAAVAAAQVSAQAMATAGHVTLGSVVSISDTNPSMPINYGMVKSAALDSAATPIQVGTQDVSVLLTVVFAIS
ncbi:MAG TPA: SIMPL domain-containing protein [Candidatus Bathyarchaeia archaeon]|jgi:uncharacterized protein YggE|nr:SIMPL domain-containing protein [Candidatus Bathyarchaeia archaeon]